MDEKRRQLSHFIGPLDCYYGYFPGDPNAALPRYDTSPIKSTQSTQSRGHKWPSPYALQSDVGGNFTTQKVFNVFSSGPTSTKGSGFGYRYRGAEHAYDPKALIDFALSQCAPNSESSITALGTKAIARCIPTNPIVDGSTFIGELKMGLPRLIGKELFQSGGKDIRKYGSEYLNIEFGWKPIISDLRKFGESIIRTEKAVNQLLRDSGKNVRRQYTFPDIVTYNETNLSAKQAWTPIGSVYPYCYYSTGGVTAKMTYKVTTRTWFSGCFTYFMDLGNTELSKISQNAAKARKLYGLELTPSTVWNLTPWSWLVDWEGTIGDSLHTMSRFGNDQMVMRYGYIMQQKTAEVSVTLPWQGRLNGSPQRDLIMTVNAISKVRRSATPYGFGFDMTALTGRQSAILGALGISRSPRRL
jgi:hypothetical protein